MACSITVWQPKAESYQKIRKIRTSTESSPCPPNKLNKNVWLIWSFGIEKNFFLEIKTCTFVFFLSCHGLTGKKTNFNYPDSKQQCGPGSARNGQHGTPKFYLGHFKNISQPVLLASELWAPWFCSCARSPKHRKNNYENPSITGIKTNI